MASGGQEAFSEYLRAVQITQALEQEEQSYDIHQRRGYQYEQDLDSYASSDSDISHEAQYSSSDSEGELDNFGEGYMNEDNSYRVAHNEADRDAEEDARPVPAWFLNKPFENNGRILLAFLPGLLLMLTLGGDMFITIATAGWLGIYLFHSAGSAGRALGAYLVTFICLQLTVIYSVLPLLWKSWLNLVLVLSLNVHSCLSGAWLLINFRLFRAREPHLTLVIELALFTLYPVVSVILVTFLVTTATSPAVAPYCLLIIGYPVCQSFLTPTASSFKKPEHGHPEKTLIMQSSHTAFGSVLYACLPPVLYILCTMFSAQNIDFGSFVELLSINCMSVILASWIDLEQFMLGYGLLMRHKHYLTLACYGVVMLSAPLLLRRHGVHGHLLPWLPLALLLHSLLVNTTMHLHRSKRAIYGSGLAVLVFYVVIMAQFPWTGNSEIPSRAPAYVMNTMILLGVILSLLCLACHVSLSKQLFGLSLIAQTIGVIATLNLLELSQQSSILLSWLITSTAFYLLLRFHHESNIPHPHACICIGLHITNALIHLPNSQSSTTPGTESTGATLPWALLEFSLLFILEYILCDVWIFHNEKLTKYQFLQALAKVLVLGALNAPFWLTRLLQWFTRAQPSFIDYTATVLVLGAIVSTKLFVTAGCEWNSAKMFAPSMFLAAILITVTEPQLSLSWENMLKWMLLISVAACMMITRLVPQLKRSICCLVLMSAAAGAPLGLALSGMAFPEASMSVHAVNSVMLSSLFVISILIWIESTHMDERVIKTACVLTTVLSIALILDKFVTKKTHTVAMEASIESSLCSVFIAAMSLSVIFKMHSLRTQSLQHTREGKLKVSKLPLLGNISTVVAMVTLCFLSPWQHSMSIYISTCLLIFLQRDHYILINHSKENNLTPTVSVAFLFLVLETCHYSQAWTAVQWWVRLVGVVELSVSLLTLPVLYVLCTVLWTEMCFISDRTVVFLTPLFAILGLVGSTCTSWLLAVVSIGSGWWLMSYKLPLER